MTACTGEHPCVLITGATGFVGHYVLAELLRRRVRCAVLLRPSTTKSLHRLSALLTDLGLSANELIDTRWLVPLEGRLPNDLPDARALALDGVIHTAASTRFDTDITCEPVRTNVAGTRRLLDWAGDQGIRSFHLVSSAYQCGRVDNPVPESVLADPHEFHNVYERTKWESEQLCMAWAGGADRSLTIYRPSVIVGARQNGRSTKFSGFYLPARPTEILSRAVEDAPHSEQWSIPLRLRGRPSGVQNIVPVDYVAAMIAAVYCNPADHGEMYHLTHPTPPTNQQIKDAIESCFQIGGSRWVAEQEFRSADLNEYEKAFFDVSRPVEHYFIDDRRRRYLDCYSGVTVMNAGHDNPDIIDPAVEQIRTLQHTTSIYLTEPVLRLAEALATIAPGDLKRSFFCASDNGAVEGALLLAALHTQRPRVVAMTNGLHERTRWAMNVTGLPMWQTDPFPLEGVDHVAFGDIEALASYLDANAGQVAAVIGEPIQGNGGIIVPPDGYWQKVRSMCDAHGVLLVLDEVQTGFNRTGRWFGCDHWGVTPDIMAVSKALGNGFPIAAFITTDEIATSYTRPGASTYGGNPVSAAAALAVIDFHRRQNLGLRALSFGRRLMESLVYLAHGNAHLHPPRGLGLMLGLPVVDEQGQPSADLCDQYLERLKDHGVLVGKTGPDRNVLTFMPPLIIGKQEMEELDHVLQTVLA